MVEVAYLVTFSEVVQRKKDDFDVHCLRSTNAGEAARALRP